VERLVSAYAEDLISLLEAFEFSMCGVCGFDADEHVYSPGPFGLPRAWCLNKVVGNPEEEDGTYRRAAIDIVKSFGEECVHCHGPLSAHTIAVISPEGRDNYPGLWCPEDAEGDGTR